MKDFEKGRYEAAARLFAKAYAIEPDPAYLFSEASAHRRLGRAEEAAKSYEKYLAVVPEGERVEPRMKARAYAIDMRIAAAESLEDAGDITGALANARKALALDDSKGAAWILVGDRSADLGDEAGARSAYEGALATEDLSPELRGHAESRLSELEAPKPAGPTLARSAPSPDEDTTAKRKGAPIVGIVAGVAGGVVLAGAVTTAIILVIRSGSLDFSDSALGRERWSAR